MKKVKVNFFRGYNSLIAFLLTILGFSSACKVIPDEPDEYGTPHATFIVKGQVQSNADSKAISNIQVVLNTDTSYSDASGNYTVQYSTFPGNQTFQVKFKDTDGAANKEFNAQDTVVEFKDPKYTGGSGTWDKGKTEKELNIKLKPKQ